MPEKIIQFTCKSYKIFVRIHRKKCSHIVQLTYLHPCHDCIVSRRVSFTLKEHSDRLFHHPGILRLRAETVSPLKGNYIFQITAKFYFQARSPTSGTGSNKYILLFVSCHFRRTVSFGWAATFAI